jgi:hypothetical protein
MLINQVDIELKLQENRDLLRQIEQERLIRRALADSQPAHQKISYYRKTLSALGKAMIELGNTLQERYGEKCMNNFNCTDQHPAHQ